MNKNRTIHDLLSQPFNSQHVSRLAGNSWFCCFWGTHPVILSSRVTPRVTQGTIWDDGVQISIWCMQGKCLPCCTINPAPAWNSWKTDSNPGRLRVRVSHVKQRFRVKARGGERNCPNFSSSSSWSHQDVERKELLTKFWTFLQTDKGLFSPPQMPEP